MSLFWNKDLNETFPMTEEVSGGSYPKRTINFTQMPVTEVWLYDADDDTHGRLYEVHRDGSIGEELHTCRVPSDAGAFWASNEEFWQCPDCPQKHYPHADFWWEPEE
jgi:hypothetical protein